jgi:hypothetical protein
VNRVIPRKHELICGSYETEIRRYYPIIDDEGAIWLIADQSNMADNIYYCDFDPRSQGFAGRTLHFVLVDGTEIDLPAPWHANSESLMRRTGIDIRDTHLTYVVIAENRGVDDSYNTIYYDVLYEDKEPVLGYFDRGAHIARRLANLLDKTLYCYQESAGGSSNSPVHPNREEEV